MKKWGTRDGSAHVRRLDAAPDVGAGVARVAAAEGSAARRTAGGRRSDVEAVAVSHRQRLQRPRRRHGGGRLRELRPHRGLRAARLDGRVREGQDRDRALRSFVSRHQGARSGEAWRGGAAHLQRSAGRRIRRRRRVSRGPDAQQRRRAARQRPQSAMAIRRRPATGAPRNVPRLTPEQMDDLAHSGGADRLRQRERAAQVRSRRAEFRAGGRAVLPSAITSAPGRCVRASR